VFSGRRHCKKCISTLSVLGCLLGICIVWLGAIIVISNRAYAAVADQSSLFCPMARIIHHYIMSICLALEATKMDSTPEGAILMTIFDIFYRPFDLAMTECAMSRELVVYIHDNLLVIGFLFLAACKVMFVLALYADLFSLNAYEKTIKPWFAGIMRKHKKSMSDEAQKEDELPETASGKSSLAGGFSKASGAGLAYVQQHYQNDVHEMHLLYSRVGNLSVFGTSHCGSQPGLGERLC